MATETLTSFMNGTLRFNIYTWSVNSITFIANGLAFVLSVSTQHDLLLWEQGYLRWPSLRRSLFIIKDLYHQGYAGTQIYDLYRSTLFSSAE